MREEITANAVEIAEIRHRTTNLPCKSVVLDFNFLLSLFRIVALRNEVVVAVVLVVDWKYRTRK
jgi:hypothetical protein